jgi:hypothetical protein
VYSGHVTRSAPARRADPLSDAPTLGRAVDSARTAPNTEPPYAERRAGTLAPRPRPKAERKGPNGMGRTEWWARSAGAGLGARAGSSPPLLLETMQR